MGITYTACTVIDSPGSPWCKTDSASNWGYCNCEAVTTPAPTLTPETLGSLGMTTPARTPCADSAYGRNQDSQGYGCLGYTTAAHCGQYDDEDFSSNSLCCSCGGGRLLEGTVECASANNDCITVFFSLQGLSKHVTREAFLRVNASIVDVMNSGFADLAHWNHNHTAVRATFREPSVNYSAVHR